jgi:acyl-CoA reductase-like NAD-dependent aldehyde dehydrogenase
MEVIMNRLEILKTYKIYINGQFPRSESGRYYALMNEKGRSIGNVCLSSRKDLRNAVVAARKALGGWSERSAFNRGQILYRIAEMLEGRATQFCEELEKQGLSSEAAIQEVHLAIDRIVYYAGWCDKFQQIASSVNPVASAHFNFSVVEPTGVVGIIAPTNSGLIGLVSLLLPSLCGGNACVVLASEKMPLCAVTFAEVLHASDVPPGVVNVLTGSKTELSTSMAEHMDINALVYGGEDKELLQLMQAKAAQNVKRVFDYTQDWMNPNAQDLHMILDTQEVKTIWHPIENIGGASSNY